MTTKNVFNFVYSHIIYQLLWVKFVFIQYAFRIFNLKKKQGVYINPFEFVVDFIIS